VLLTLLSQNISVINDTAESKLSGIIDTEETAESIIKTFKGFHFISRENQTKFKQG
jgi:hypothetical protein